MASFRHRHRRIPGEEIVGGGDRQRYPSPSPHPRPPGAYFSHRPPPPQHQHHSYHHQRHYPPPPPMAMAPPPPPPYHIPPPPRSYSYRSQYPPPRPHHPIPVHRHYPPRPTQAWGNSSYPQHQGSEYSERNILYNNQGDCAARAQAWAAARSGTGNAHIRPHFISVGRTDNHTYSYRDQYQHAVGPPQNVQQLSFPESSNQQFPVGMMDPLKQVNCLHGSTPYGTYYNAGDETTSTNADRATSFLMSDGPTSSIYGQEVSYSYSSATGNREAVHQSNDPHIPHVPVYSVQQGPHLQPTLPVQMISAEQPHLSHHGHPANFLPDAYDQPLQFEPRYDANRESHQKINHGHDTHDLTTSIAPGVRSPEISLGPAGKQAAVPNSLREEILNKKPVISSTVSTLPTENSFDSTGAEGDDNIISTADQGDNDIYTTRSKEEEEEEEEDLEAAIDQDVKRILTEVLSKVTDELFDEISTKVLNEDVQSIGEAEKSTANVKQRLSLSKAIPAHKASAEVVVPVNIETNKVDSVVKDSNKITPGGNILGQANYASDASDDDDDIKSQSSKPLSSEKKAGAHHQQEINDMPFESKSIEDEAGIDGVAALCEEPIPADTKKVKELPPESTTSFQPNNTVDARNGKRDEFTSGHGKSDKLLSKDYRDGELKKTSRETSVASDSKINEDGNKLNKKMKREMLKERADRISGRGPNVKESISRRNSKHNSINENKERTKVEKDKYIDYGKRKRERSRDKKADRSTQATNESFRYNSRRSPSPSRRRKNSKDNSFSHGSASGDAPFSNSKKRKESYNSSLSPSPSKSRKGYLRTLPTI